MSAGNIRGFRELSRNYEVFEGQWMGTFLHCKMFQKCMARSTAAIKMNKISKIAICWTGHIKFLRENLAWGRMGTKKFTPATLVSFEKFAIV
jgi:hypothetical protein